MRSRFADVSPQPHARLIVVPGGEANRHSRERAERCVAGRQADLGRPVRQRRRRARRTGSRDARMASDVVVSHDPRIVCAGCPTHDVTSNAARERAERATRSTHRGAAPGCESTISSTRDHGAARVEAQALPTRRRRHRRGLSLSVSRRSDTDSAAVALGCRTRAAVRPTSGDTSIDADTCRGGTPQPKSQRARCTRRSAGRRRERPRDRSPARRADANAQGRPRV